MNLNCPNCGSEHTQKLTAIVSSGTKYTSSSGRATSFGSVGSEAAVVTTTSSSSSVSSTDLANRLAPPSLKRYIGPLDMFILCVFSGFLALFVASRLIDSLGLNFSSAMWIWGPAAFGGYLYAQRKFSKLGEKNRKWNAEVYPDLYSNWQKRFYCHRCEFIYVPLVQHEARASFNEKAQDAMAGVDKQLNQLNSLLETKHDQYR